jgi:hypothetical protein
MIGEQKPSLEELRHYGVKGMKWRKRRIGLVEVDAHKVEPGIKPFPGGKGRIPIFRRPMTDGKITDASQIKIPEGRRHHNAAIDAWLRNIKNQRLIAEAGKQKTDDILGVVGALPVPAPTLRPEVHSD